MPPSTPTNLTEYPASSDLTAELSPEELVNRDLSWLQFNRRVLHEAEDPRTPLLDRVRFYNIFNSNLDEFFMKRVGALARMLDSAPAALTRDGLMPEQQLKLVRESVIQLVHQQSKCFEREIRPALLANGIELLAWSELTAAERNEAEAYFRASVFPILTPLAVDPGHPFPFISNLSTSLVVILQHPDRPENLFARIKVPEMLPGWVRLKAGDNAARFRFFSLYDLIRNNLDDLFLDMRIIDVSLFRVTRSVEPEVEDDDDAEDLRDAMQEELRLRRFAPVVRVEHDADLHPDARTFLMDEMDVSSMDLYEMPLGLNYQDLTAIFQLKLPNLSIAPWTPCVPPALSDSDADFFNIIRGGDLLVHHPYESFHASVERFVSAAAADPKVLAIKMTLYRTGDESPFIRTLIRAAEAGKQVVALVELKARFDEQRNIMLTRTLEKAGVHVVYGVLDLKTHSKVTLVVRQEHDGIRCYAHIGTGNYHTETARLYTDLGLFTCDPDITGDLVELFHFLTGRSQKKDYRKLLVAPVNMRRRFLEMMDREIEHARAGRPARILGKMNSLEDRRIIAKLYEASAAGVEIDLIVRGLCSIRPDLPGKSERIRVVSIIGRFLEHSRIFYFQNGATDPLEGDFYLGSTDWMYRNLLGRIEVVVPIEARPLRERCWEVLQIMLRDQRQAWDMQSDGSYVQRTPAASGAVAGPEDAGTHQVLMELTRQRCSLVTS